MQIIKPSTYSSIDTILVSSTVPETDFAAWAAATNYTSGTKVIRTTTHRIYQNLIAGVDAGLPENTPSRWQDIGPTNRHAMFDALSTTQTLVTDSLTVVLDPASRVSSLAFINLKGTNLTITATNDGAEEIYSKTISLNQSGVTSWYDWFFEPFTQKRDVFYIDFPVAYLNPIITITISTDPGSTCGVGRVIWGRHYDSGNIEFGAKVSIKDYSVKTVDANNNSYLTKKTNVKLLSFNGILNQADTLRISNTLRDLLSVPCVFIGYSGDGYEYLSAHGFYQNFTIVALNPVENSVSLEIEELT